MASGCPVAAADAGALPEVCGDAAELFDPFSPDSMAAAIERTLADRSDLVAAGLERTARYSWASCAETHVAMFHEAARLRRPVTA